MKRTYTTILPDKAGAFLAASEIMGLLDLNITRVSYNKAVDTHMLFIEAEGSEEQLDKANSLLAEKGYLPNGTDSGSVILLEFKLRDTPGSVQPVLKLINSFDFNISYISSQASGGEYQLFRMGLFIENSGDISDFIKKASALCDVKIIDYNKTENILDNTVFYMSFANQIAEQAGLDEEDKRCLIINSNIIMEILSKMTSPPYKTFEYIGKFAEKLCVFHGDKYNPRISKSLISENLAITVIEPPAGSNISIIEHNGSLLTIDSGFACYKNESMAAIKALFPNFDTQGREIIITHADVDHCGLLDRFDSIYLSWKCYKNFLMEQNGESNFREGNPLHAPYVKISKILSAYKPPEISRLHIVGGSNEKNISPIELIGSLHSAGLDFEIYEGAGGHVLGEIVIVERRHRFLFTGDIFVNVKGFTSEQAAFNRLAPYLMTSVDTDPQVAAQERNAVFEILDKGRWLLFSGHGKSMEIDI